jgi:transketolase
MVGCAAGLARAGMVPFVYSIVPFLTLRCLEQIKLDLCYNRAPVTLVGVGGGYAYGHSGATHHGIDDVGVLSCLPNLRILTPADPMEVRACVQSAPGCAQPTYLRLGRNNEPSLHDPCGPLPDIDYPSVLRRGEDGMLLTYGAIVHEVLAAATALETDGFRWGVAHLPTFRPFPRAAARALLSAGMPVVTVEEHVATGGLGHEIAVLLAEERLANPLRMLCAPLEFQKTCLGREAALAWAGIDAPSIAGACRDMLKTPGDRTEC